MFSKLLKAASSSLRKFLTLALQTLVSSYQILLGPWLGGACRFEPSCSCYAQECLHTHSAGKALKLIAIRLSKCRPGGPFGFDPVPTEGSSHARR